MDQYDAIVVGGGLAGLAAAIHLAGEGLSVLLFEKHPYPRHKVCGEYVSNEIGPYLRSLGISLPAAVPIRQLRLTTRAGRSLYADLPLGGFGISRYALDETLYLQAIRIGVEVRIESVIKVDYESPGFTVHTTSEASYHGKVVIGAYGKRASLDRELGRDFINQRSPWLAVKAHYAFPSWPGEQVGLFPFRGGYAGLSRTESGACNFCYLASFKSFRPHGSIDSYQQQVLSQNSFLKHFLSEAEMIFEAPLTIAQVSFGGKEAVYRHILMCGDSAGMIHPLCGNGMAMALHGGKIAAECIIEHLRAKTFSQEALEKEYKRRWQAVFSRRLQVGRWLQGLLLNENLSGLALGPLSRTPWLLRKLIEATHGKPVTV